MSKALGGRPFRGTTTGGAGDLYDSGFAGLVGVCLGAKLVAAAAAATAQITDSDGTVLFEMSAPVNGADWQDVPVQFRGKVRLNAIAGAGAAIVVYIQ